jgi:hypothetical protein
MPNTAALNLEGKIKDEVSKTVDYYHEEISPHVYYFDTMQELANIIDSGKLLDSKNVKKSGPKFMRQQRKKTLDGWTELFKEIY